MDVQGQESQKATGGAMVKCLCLFLTDFNERPLLVFWTLGWENPLNKLTFMLLNGSLFEVGL